MFRKSRRRLKLVTGFLRTAIAVRWLARALLIFLIMDLFYLTLTWPDWKKAATGPVPKSNFIVEYEHQRAENPSLPRLRWNPVPLSVLPKTLVRAVIVAEDSRFYEHSGFDLIAFKEAMEYNYSEGRLAMGASTISQQTVKNLFLSSSRNPLRKWHELILTWGMEHNLTKQRIMDIYLNVAEFGPGIYGAQAAAQAYWGIDASRLSPVQAAELAATLPAPTRNNPGTRTRHFESRARKIFNLLVRYPGSAADAIAGLHLEPMPEVDAPGAEPDPELPPAEDRGTRQNTL
jgi:monofunctional glycosyltransferase